MQNQKQEISQENQRSRKKLVNVISIAIVAVVAISFLGLGGIDRVKAFASGIPQLKDSLPTSTKGGSTLETAKNSQKAIESLGTQDIIKTTVTSSRKNQKQFGIISDPSVKDVKLLSGRGTAQFSTGQITRLSPQQLRDIRSRSLTAQERKDVAALEARRDRAIARGISPNVKLSGAELVLRKRQQEQLSKQLITSKFGKKAFQGGKLFANPDFESGGLTSAIQAERDATQATIQENLRLNAIEKEKQIAEGTQLLKKTGTTAKAQKEFFSTTGVNIIGGNILSARAIAKLAERGIII